MSPILEYEKINRQNKNSSYAVIFVYECVSYFAPPHDEHPCPEDDVFRNCDIDLGPTTILFACWFLYCADVFDMLRCVR